MEEEKKRISKIFDSVTQQISTDVAALTEGVLRAMFYTKLKIAVAICLTLAVMAAGVGVVSVGAVAGPAERTNATERANKDAEVVVALAADRGETKKPAGVVFRSLPADDQMLVEKVAAKIKQEFGVPNEPARVN